MKRILPKKARRLLHGGLLLAAIYLLGCLLVDSPALNAALRADTEALLRQGRTLTPAGAILPGADYFPPEEPLLKKLLQPVLRAVICPFRYLL